LEWEASKRRRIMKTFLRSVLFTALLAFGANGLIAGTARADKVTLRGLLKQTKALEARAESARDHQNLAADYHLLAQLQREESSEFAERADWYARFPIYTSEKFRRSTIDPSRYFAEKYRRDAEPSEELAVRHERLAS
jgi:hypothetical protein